MSQIFQQGALNTTALVVPDLYVQIVPPQNILLNGVPSNIIGVVGTATWGAVGQPITVGSMAQYAINFGPIMPRKYDMGTQLATATQQGANNFKCVRVTDGTDTAASANISTNGVTITALYTGTLGNSLSVTLQAGSKAGTFAAIVGMPGMTPERYDNIAGTGNAFWVALAAAINSGNSPFRGPSNLVKAAAGAGTAAPVAGASPLSGGTDGATTITASVLVGVDVAPRMGMYALRNQGCSIGLLADTDDSTQWANQVAFGSSEGVYMILTGPAGDTLTNAPAVKATAGIDTYCAKMMFGDWVYWSDTVNQITRLVSPQGFVAGRLGNLDPSQSTLNKPIYGVVGTQKNGLPSAQVTTYSVADLTVLETAGIDVITNPAPGGAYYACRIGHNASSNAAVNGDNYTRLTNYIAATMASGMGQFVGAVISPSLLRRVKGALASFAMNMVGQGLLPRSLSGALPFAIICDVTNNPDSRTGLGYLQADCQFKFGPIAEKFLVNMEGGQTVQVQRQTLPSGQVGA